MSKKLVELLDEATFKKDVKDNFRPLTEATMSRVIGKYFDIGFIAISAHRDCETEKGSPCDEEEQLQQIKRNKQNEKQIARDIRQSKFGYVPTYGGYEEMGNDGKKIVVNELSFIVPAQRWDSRSPADYKKLKELGIALSKKYNQDSFLYKPPREVDTNAYFIKKDGETDMTFSDVAVDDLEQVFFTTLRKKDGTRFSMKEGSFSLYVPRPPHDYPPRSRMGELFIREKEDYEIMERLGVWKTVEE